MRKAFLAIILILLSLNAWAGVSKINGLNISPEGVYFVKDYAVGDGVTDDYAAIQALFDAVPDGSTIEFDPDQSYYSSNILRIYGKNGIKLKGNGCTVIPAPDLIAAISASYTVSTNTSLSISFTAGSRTFTIPGGLSLSVGQMINAYSSSSGPTTGYNYGIIAEITSISGSTATMDVPALDTFTATNVDVYSVLKNSEITGFCIDATGATDHIIGINARGSQLRIYGNILKGNTYAGIGINIEANNSEIYDNFCDTFFNINGFGSAGNRHGYGICASGQNISIHNNTCLNNKHNIVIGMRTFNSANVVVRNNYCYNDLTYYSSIISGGYADGQAYVLPSLDVHGYCNDVTFEENYVYSCGTPSGGASQAYGLINIRNGNAILRGNQLHYVAGSDGDALIGVHEMALTNLVFEGNLVTTSNTLVFLDNGAYAGVTDVAKNVVKFSNNTIPETITHKGCIIRDHDLYASAAPTSATYAWAVGDVIFNSAPSAGEPLGWRCTVAGSPGTWENIEIAGGGITVSATAPSSPSDADEWFQPRTNDTGGGILWQYSSALSAWVPVRQLGNITLYVDSSGTNDVDHGTGADTSAFATLTYALSCLPKNNGGYNVTINMDDDTFTDTPAITGFSGSGTLTVNGTLTQRETGTVSDTSSVQGTGATRGTVRDTGGFMTTVAGDLITSASNAGTYRVVQGVAASNVATIIGTWPTAAPADASAWTSYYPGTVIDGAHTRNDLLFITNNTCPIVLNNIKINDPLGNGLRIEENHGKVNIYRSHFINTADSISAASNFLNSSLVTAYQCYFNGYEKYAVSHGRAWLTLSGCLLKNAQKGGTGIGLYSQSTFFPSNVRLSSGTTIDTGNYGIWADKSTVDCLSVAASGYIFVANQNTEGVYAKNHSIVFNTNVQYSGNTDDELTDAGTGSYIGTEN
jgi:hypothetical protein